ncbi:hypothetical protein ACJMK2_005745 [Sinanodonta woodiana]|uniref:Ig-like domain-containing protein n=1 Tax=Sinanodonta woodiana TaxID=1069815 RepID=A0ABD3VSL8_SINWO
MFRGIYFKPISLWICVLVFILSRFRTIVSTCPGVCFCPSITRNVYCPRKNLPYVPNGIPLDTIQLNLNDNNFVIPTISRTNFSRFTDLEQLYLSGCGIEFIEVDTFIDLKKLKWLDISKNRLKSIADYTFRDLTLEHLFLNDNPGVHISKHAFLGLNTMGLYFQNCALGDLTLEILRPLNGTLKSLWIDGNKFETFNPNWLYLFKTLSHLRIGDNPLHCNCEVAWLFKFYQSTPRVFEGVTTPSCRSPPRLRGKQFSAVTDDDFRCQLPVFKNVDIVFESDKGKLTCSASGDPVPTLYWIKPDGSWEKFSPKVTDLSRDTEGVMYTTNPRPSKKSMYQCIASNPAGNVTFSLNVVWPSDDRMQNEPPSKDPIKETEEYPVKVEKEGTVEGQKSEASDKYVSSNVNVTKSSVNMADSREQSKEIRFSLVDIIGAVVGTFLLTLLACVVVFHVFSRNQSRLIYKEQNGLTHNDIKRGPPSRYELDEAENTIKMLDKMNRDAIV